MRFAALGSGSQGNALVVEHDGFRVLVDCGFGLAQCVQRLDRLGLSPSVLHAVLVTHEHEDHIGGVARLAAHHQLPVYMTSGTLRGLEPVFSCLEVRLIEGYQAFSLGSLQIAPYPVPHDAREPAQFVFSDGSHRLGLLTDAGSATNHMLDILRGCDGLLLECNHDLAMLQGGTYPAALKRRISGKWGHLDNDTAYDLLRRVRTDKLRVVVGMHLSEQNNNPERVRAGLEDVMGTSATVSIAYQDIGTPWISLGP